MESKINSINKEINKIMYIFRNEMIGQIYFDEDVNLAVDDLLMTLYHFEEVLKTHKYKYREILTK